MNISVLPYPTLALALALSLHLGESTPDGIRVPLHACAHDSHSPGVQPQTQPSVNLPVASAVIAADPYP